MGKFVIFIVSIYADNSSVGGGMCWWWRMVENGGEWCEMVWKCVSWWVLVGNGGKWLKKCFKFLRMVGNCGERWGMVGNGGKCWGLVGKCVNWLGISGKWWGIVELYCKNTIFKHIDGLNFIKAIFKNVLYFVIQISCVWSTSIAT